MISSIPATRSVFTPRLYHAVRAGKTQVPVRPAQTVYAHLEHVEGIPSRSQTVPLVKLRVLDRLIDRLAAVGRGGAGEPSAVEPTGAPEGPSRTSRAPSRAYAPVASGPTAPYTVFTGPSVEPGVLVSVLA